MAHAKILNLLLADDDQDDICFFKQALKKISVPTKIIVAENGEMVLDYLSKKQDSFPDIIFLDMNMPRKNGFECLVEIKADIRISSIPIIIYSTFISDTMAHLFYEKGAHYYIKKCDQKTLVKYLDFILNKLSTETFERETIDNFILNLPVFK